MKEEIVRDRYSNKKLKNIVVMLIKLINNILTSSSNIHDAFIFQLELN